MDNTRQLKLTRLQELTRVFGANIAQYKSGSYDEANTRVDFIDKFFELLDWDVRNTQGFSEDYREVVREDKVYIEGKPKAPDYSFRIGGFRKFFVEAKKPSIHIKEDIVPAYQVRRYAYTAKLPLSILTDFEEFAVYDTRIKPSPADKASVARVFYCTFNEYEEQFDFIHDTFSKNAILKGSFDQYVSENKNKKGTSEVDREFLKLIEEWRSELARSIALRNKDLDVYALNNAVQTIIDRIIFLRIAEDRRMEEYGSLLAAVRSADSYKNLEALFRKADSKYNSGLFKIEDWISLLVIDDKACASIVKGLYYPDCPYELSVLPIEILGQIYEQFLGKTIRLTAGHQAKIEEKPEVRKAGGVYYTPQYIVDYIVEHTVGEKIKDKKPEEIESLKVLDPACGSGSFLVGAYHYLLDYHLNHYSGEKNLKKSLRDGIIYQIDDTTYRLSILEKQRILLNNIHGMDIDRQAVEVTKLSLLLKLMEDENVEAAGELFKHSDLKLLPDLSANIKCGNSLIGTDFYDDKNLDLFDKEELRKVNAFDWEKEFPEVFAKGGFDCVIGNPPYVRMEEFKELKVYLKEKYACHNERSDLFAYFIERGHCILTNNGRFGMIVSNKFLRANYGEPLREFLRKNTTILYITDFAGLPIFPNATVRTMVIITKKENQQQGQFYYSPPPNMDVYQSIANGSLTVDAAITPTFINILPSALQNPIWSFVEGHIDILLNKLHTGFTPLADYCEGNIGMGIKSGCTEAFMIDTETREKIIKNNRECSNIIKPLINGRDIKRYYIDDPGLFIIYTFHGIDMSSYTAAIEHLQTFRKQLTGRATNQQWYELQQPQYNFAQWMESPKIIFPDIAVTPRFALDEKGFYSSNTTYFIPRRDLYLLGLLNSKLGTFYFEKTCAGLEGKNETYLRFFGQYLKGFPVKVIDSNNKSDLINRDSIISLVDSTLSNHQQLYTANTESDKKTYQQKADLIDRQIDALVYELYGLTEEEIAIVEGRK